MTLTSNVINANNVSNVIANEPVNLQDPENGATMQAAENTGEGSTGQEPNISDNAKSNPDAQEQIIAQQQTTIETLLQRTQQLTEQLNAVVKASGVQFSDNGAQAASQQPQKQQGADDDDYVTLKDLGKEFGKRNYQGR